MSEGSFAHDIANGSITVSGIERFFSGCGLLMFSYLQSHKDRKSVMNRDLAGYLEEVFEEVHELDFDSNGFYNIREELENLSEDQKLVSKATSSYGGVTNDLS